MNIRRETVADRGQVAEVIRLAFGRDAEALLVDELRREKDFIGELSLVAIVDDADGQSNDSRISGHIFFSPMTLGDTPALALAPLVVRPEFQRQGIGSALVRAGHTEAARLGHKIVVVVGYPEYYPKFGYKPARARGLEAPFPVRDEAFMVLELVPGALEGVSGMASYAMPFSRV